MGPSREFQGYCRNYFARLCRGYQFALDDTRVRAWTYGPKTPSDNGGAFDMSARIFPALCAWLSDARRPTTFTLRGTTVDLEELARSILENAFDPAHPGYWEREQHPARNQRTVESSMLAYGAWLVRDTLLPKISPKAIRYFQDWLEYFGSGELVTSNWNLFWIVNHTARKALGWKHDPQVTEAAWKIIEALERGGGWMTDGPEHSFDDYNWWVFGTHELFWAELDGSSNSARVERIRQRIRDRLADYPFFFGADGSYSEFGRSLTYKFARLGCPVHAYRKDLWPHSPGMLKRLVWRHLASYDHNGALDRHTDIVRQELSEFGHTAVREDYINTGHPYWCMHAFVALWQLRDDDPFWTCEEQPLPVEQGDFRRVIKPAGWIVTGTKSGGHVQRYSLGTQHGKGSYAAKYGKFVYGTQFPVNFGSADGDYGPDSALCLTDGEHWAHPGFYEAFAAEPDYLRARYSLKVGPIDVPCQTILVPDGPGCLRIHRLKTPKAAGKLLAVEGGAAFGYASGLVPTKAVDAKLKQSLVWSGRRASLIRGLQGYTRAVRAQGFRGNDQLNAVWEYAITPTLEATLVAGKETTLVCWTSAFAAGLPKPLPDPKVKVTWKKDGAVELQWDKRKIKIPAL